MSGNFQLEIKAHQEMLDKLFAEEAKRKQAEADQARKKAESRKATMKFLGQFVDTAIKFGTLTSEQVNIYLTNYRKEYGDNALVAKYLAMVVQLITHPQYGCESTTARFGNGGLLWRGQTYKNVHELHEALVDLMAGFDPFDNNVVWLEYLLQDLFEDESKLAAAPFTDTWQTEVILIRKLVEQSKNAVEIPDINNLTTDDLFIIQSMVGGF
jgi:hypothetical protein